jgi:uncharacterized protein (TIGR01777 family)
MIKNVLITGGTGFIGKYLTDVLTANGYTVSILSRSEKKNTATISYYKWNVESSFIEEEAILKADYIIHLAGEGIVEKRWSEKRKKDILDSRVRPIELIALLLKQHNKQLDAFISASAIGIYGAITSQEICKETSPPANDFLGHTCQEWEKAVDQISSLGIRTAKIRTGIVLGRNEGFLKKVQPSFKLGFGSILGTGDQYLPWIHIEDLCNIYLKTVQDQETNGAYNAAVGDNTTNASFSKALARQFGYSIWLPKVPSFFLKIILGQMSQAILEGTRVSSKKIKKTGFEFQFTDLETALTNFVS